jgi:hypothetical protein
MGWCSLLVSWGGDAHAIVVGKMYWHAAQAAVEFWVLAGQHNTAFQGKKPQNLLFWG